MQWVNNAAVRVIDHILGQSACELRVLHQMFFSTAASQKWGAGQGRAEQPSLINYSLLLCTTPLSAKVGMDARMDGRTDR